MRQLRDWNQKWVLGLRHLSFFVAGQSCGDEVTEGPHLAASGSLQNQTLHQSSIASIDDYLIALAAQHQPDVDVGLIGESRGSINTTYIECGYRYSQPPVPSSKHTKMGYASRRSGATLSGFWLWMLPCSP